MNTAGPPGVLAYTASTAISNGIIKHVGLSIGMDTKTMCGGLAELIIYKKAPSLAETKQIEDYLNTKYGLGHTRTAGYTHTQSGGCGLASNPSSFHR